MPFKIICLRNIKMRAKIVFFANLMRQPVVLNLLIILQLSCLYTVVFQTPCQCPAVLEYSTDQSNQVGLIYISQSSSNLASGAS